MQFLSKSIRRTEKNACYLNKRCYYNGMNRLPLENSPNPLHALRGIVHAVDFAGVRRIDQYRTKLLVDAGKACAASTMRRSGA